MKFSITVLHSVGCHGAMHLCSHKGEPVLTNAGHDVRAKTNQPIFGVLTQPLPEHWNEDLESTYHSFFESSHADFLQAAGARVVPIDYRMDSAMLNRELASISGVYIPGHTKQSFEDDQYLAQVHRIVEFASKHNREEDKHFPVVGVSWGMLSLLKSQTSQDSLFQNLGDHLIGEPLQ